MAAMNKTSDNLGLGGKFAQTVPKTKDQIAEQIYQL
jgi:hypothetical protein